MLWEVEIAPLPNELDREGIRILAECRAQRLESIESVKSARSFLIEGALNADDVHRLAVGFLGDPLVESVEVRELTASVADTPTNGSLLANTLFKPGVTDNVAGSTLQALKDRGLSVEAVATCLKYEFNSNVSDDDRKRLATRILANESIQHVTWGPLHPGSLAIGKSYHFSLQTKPIRGMSADELTRLSREGKLSLSLVEMQTIQKHFEDQGRDPTDAELETVAQTWSEHCSHKTLAGRVHYRDEQRDLQFENMLKETIFAATQTIRKQLGPDDWCVSVFRDNAGIVKFDDEQNVCFKVETHNHPSAIEPYGGANTGLGGVIRDPLGTGLGARPVCNTDVFCFAPPDTPYDTLPPSVLHPKTVAHGVVAGVRDYGNRMGIPTVNGAVFFDPRYLGNPLVYCGNVAMIPVGMEHKGARHGDLIVTVGGRTGLDGIHGATFSSIQLDSESESLSGGSVQIGNAITEKMVMDVVLEARDRQLYTAITDCGAGGFSSAIGEMGEETGAEVWLDKAPLKYTGLSYTDIWISEAQERMILAVPPDNWQEFEAICRSEGVEATAIGEFQDTGRLVLKYGDEVVGDMAMSFLHDGRPPVIRDAVYTPPAFVPLQIPEKDQYDEDLKKILGSLNVCSKEWIIRQYDHEVQAGSVVKPLVGVAMDGPSDAAVVRPNLHSQRGLVISNGMNPCYGDFDPYWMAASAIDEALRNAVSVGADPARIAILDNFCWGNTERAETLGSLVRAALACQDAAVAFGTPFISGKDSLNNEFAHQNDIISIPSSLLISALGQIDDVRKAVTMDLKSPGNQLYLIGGPTHDELGGSHFSHVNGLTGGAVPQVDLKNAPAIFQSVHELLMTGLVRACHDLSEGGLAVTLAEMAFAGEYGVQVDLQKLAEQTGIKNDAVLLFSESNTRFVVEVAAEANLDIAAQFPALHVTLLGQVTRNGLVEIKGINGSPIVNSDWNSLKQVWQSPLAWE